MEEEKEEEFDTDYQMGELGESKAEKNNKEVIKCLKEKNNLIGIGRRKNTVIENVRENLNKENRLREVESIIEI